MDGNEIKTVLYLLHRVSANGIQISDPVDNADGREFITGVRDTGHCVIIYIIALAVLSIPLDEL